MSAKDDIYPVAVQVVGELGGLDVLVNNASDLGPVPLMMLSDTECEDLERAFSDERDRAVPSDEGADGGAGRFGARGARRGRPQHLQRRGGERLPGWGAYGASKAALHHLSRIWGEEHEADGVRFLSLDPGDMDTPMHAAAIPDADPSTLKRPEDAARELADAVAAALPKRAALPNSKERRYDRRGHGRSSARRTPSSWSLTRTDGSATRGATPSWSSCALATSSSPTTRRRCPRA